MPGVPGARGPVVSTVEIVRMGARAIRVSE